MPCHTLVRCLSLLPGSSACFLVKPSFNKEPFEVSLTRTPLSMLTARHVWSGSSSSHAPGDTWSPRPVCSKNPACVGFNHSPCDSCVPSLICHPLNTSLLLGYKSELVGAIFGVEPTLSPSRLQNPIAMTHVSTVIDPNKVFYCPLNNIMKNFFNKTTKKWLTLWWVWSREITKVMLVSK
jgi:hypothetical protein